MSRATCPSCGSQFDNHRPHGPRSLRGRLLFGPERLIAKAKRQASDLDTCPRCRHAFVSDDFAFFGRFARARLQSMAGIYAIAGLLIAAMVASLWLSGR
jgi:hypothetical protein